MKNSRCQISLCLLFVVAGLGGCSWDASLYETYARNNEVVQCPPGNLVINETEAEQSYVNLKTLRCYAGALTIKTSENDTSGKDDHERYPLSRDEVDGHWKGWDCVDRNQNCLAPEDGHCDACAEIIEDYRMCLALQDFSEIYVEGNEKMPSISFIGDYGTTTNHIFDYPDAGKNRICPSDFGKCYYHKEDKLSTAPGEFGCVSSCPSTLVECGGQCIDPKTNTAFCGASGDCSEGSDGESCADGLSCIDGECKLLCTKDQVICGDQCINPSKDDDHCGARGKCNSNDVNSTDYVGDKCSSGLNCIEGKCILECQEGQIKCPNLVGNLDRFESLAETEKQCINPLRNSDFCGAEAGCKNSEQCAEGQDCQGKCVCTGGKQWCPDAGECADLKTSNEHCGECGKECESDDVTVRTCISGKCTVISCNNNYKLCKNEKNEITCIDVYGDDPDNCSACGYRCADHPLSHAVSNKCSAGKCLYKCDDGLTNCGEGVDKNGMNSAPNCVNTTNNSDNCGGCASIDEHFVCKSNYYCSDSSCVQSKCDGNQCRLNDTCVNTVVTCGTRCTDCTSLQGVSKASCDAGYCKASLCLSNYHLKIESAETVCEENTIELCGKPDSNVIYNCYSVLNAKDPENVGNYDIFCDLGECKFECKPGFTRTKDDLCVANNEHNCNGVDCYNQYQTAATVKCDEGVCKVMTCHDEYHLIKKNGELECEANTIKKCGKGDSQTTRDCTKAFSDANDVSCNHGVCEIVSCKSGYHLSGEPGDYQCVKNSSTSCGKPDSAVTYDCNTIPMASGNCTSSGVCECSYNGNTNSYTILEFGQDGESLYCRTHVTCGGVVCENQEGWHFGWCENFGSYYHPDYRCYSKTCQKGYHKKKIVIGNDWTADCEINTNEACGIVTTGGDQIDKYPISCSSMSATCNNDYGLCYRESDHKYYCQSGETSGFNWRNLSDCYYK